MKNIEASILGRRITVGMCERLGRTCGTTPLGIKMESNGRKYGEIW